MEPVLSRFWWVFAVRGLAAIIFGILALIWPGITLLSLVILFAAYALVDGIFSVIAGIRAYGESDRWWAELLEGIAGILFAVIAVIWPGVTTFALLYLIAAWAVVTGVLEIAAAIRLRRELTGEWVLILSGILSILFGAFLFISPGAGALALVTTIGAFGVVFGIMLIILAFRLRSMRSTETGTGPGAQSGGARSF